MRDHLWLRGRARGLPDGGTVPPPGTASTRETETPAAADAAQAAERFRTCESSQSREKDHLRCPHRTGGRQPERDRAGDLEARQAHDGFLAESDQSSLAQNQRHASWRVRIPAANFEAFVGEVVRLGEVRQNHVGSQDITEQYLDLEARIRNKREEEKRLLKHLADSTGKLEDILAVERELSRVRGEAEQMEGRLRFLADRSELSTVTIEANEWKDYKPPVAATFGTQVKRAFFTSVDRLVEFGKALAILVVVLAPWVPLMLLGLVLVRLLIRYAGRTSRPGPPRAAPILTPRPEGRP